MLTPKAKKTAGAVLAGLIVSVVGFAAPAEAATSSKQTVRIPERSKIALIRDTGWDIP